jgi:formate hydrogenlyase subunit 6/NADH:ubiquinone oxidoreductase subunit I
MLCSLCGICIEVCPTEALTHDSANYDVTATARSQMVNDLLKPFRDRGVDLARPILTPAQKKALAAQKTGAAAGPAEKGAAG